MTIDPNPGFRITEDSTDIDWQRLAVVTARAPLGERDPADIARAYANSFAAAFAWQGDLLIGAARAVSDGVFYAAVYDVVVDPEFQGHGVGRALMESLLPRLPFDKVFLTAVPGKQDFYARFGFLRQSNAMGRYTEPLRGDAIARGVLCERDTLASEGPIAISN